MKKICFILLMLLGACVHKITPPETFQYREIKTGFFTLASWQKITDPSRPIKFYIEGDGHAFNHRGRPTNNPTPRGIFMRHLAFNDPSANVVYLARPCQYVQDPQCDTVYWTTGRFAPAVIQSTAKAVHQIAGHNDVIFIGYSGGAQVAALTAVMHPEIHVRHLVTIAGNLNHTAWTDSKGLQKLSDSMDLADYKKAFTRLPQTHYVGEKDTVISPDLTRSFVPSDSIIMVLDATHATGFESIYPSIWQMH